MKRYVDYFEPLIHNAPTMIVYDSFRGHLEESVKKKFKEINVDLAVIPGGLTSMCQPLDVTINKPFKDNLRKEWHLWMAGGGAGTTSAGNLRRASLSDVCGWVKRAWNKIPDEMIIESFKTCKISTSFGSDDETDDDGEINEDEISEDEIEDDDSIGGNDTSEDNEDDGSSGV